jgi:hypothetical protein
VEYDHDPANPQKEWDNVGTVVLSNRCRYDFGNETVSYDEIQALVDDPNNICLPIYMYDHSGITINTTGFSCPWDSGQVGIIYCTKQKAVQEWGKKVCTPKVREAAIKYMQGEIKTLDQYLTGQVYGFQVYDPDGCEADSCWGFYGDEDDCLEEGLVSARHLEAKWLEDKRKTWRGALHEARQRKYWATRDVVTTGARA